MQLGIPALVFIATALAVGGACLSYLRSRYHTTDHHLMIFVLIGAVGYLAPSHMKRAASLEREKLRGIWVGTARSYVHGLERVGVGAANVDEQSLQQTLRSVTERLKVPAHEVRKVTLVTEIAKGRYSYVTSGVYPTAKPLGRNEGAFTGISAAFSDQEGWSENLTSQGRVYGVDCLIPVRAADDKVEAVLIVTFDGARWAHLQSMAEWRVAGEFLGLLSICLLMAGFLVSRAEGRRQKEVESAIQSLKEELESLGGMVNSMEGVVWERPANAPNFTFVSQQAEGYLGYKTAAWTDERGFLASIILPEDLPRVRESWKKAITECSAYQIEYRAKRADGETATIAEQGQASRLPMQGLVLRGVLVDVTKQRENEAAKENMQRMLLDASRQAGMAEIATGVLHNVGNVLNSLNVGAKLLSERLRRSRLERLCQATALVKEHLPDDPEFFVKDKRGQALPGYLDELATYLRDEQNRLTANVGDMIERIDHIRDMIMLQQSHSAVRTLWEPLDLATIMEDALRLEGGANLTHQSVKIERQYADLPPVYLSRGLLLQILVNLVANAYQAMSEVPPQERRLTLRIVPHGSDRVRLCVEDSGCGIPERNLTQIFTQGFTTKSNGHGFGLHHACLLAEDMGGALRAESDGAGKGARFILELPARNSPPSETGETATALAAEVPATANESSERNPTLP